MSHFMRPSTTPNSIGIAVVENANGWRLRRTASIWISPKDARLIAQAILDAANGRT